MKIETIVWGIHKIKKINWESGTTEYILYKPTKYNIKEISKRIKKGIEYDEVELINQLIIDYNL